MNLCLYFISLFSDVVEIWYRRSIHNAVEDLRVS
jgi:hypothetical protein